MAGNLQLRTRSAVRVCKSIVPVCLATLLCLGTATQQMSAHGEAADEPFLKVLTSAFYDVSITPTQVEVGQPVTISGTVRILDTWPYTLNSPGRAFITAVVPGPVFAMKERMVNGEWAPHSIFVQRGGEYNFRMQLIARRAGEWHVHPGIAVEGTGTLIGPGEWVKVSGNESAFTFPLSLMGGETIDLDTYRSGFVWWFPFIVFLVGVVWMLYWTLVHRTITNLAVTVQVPLNDDAPDIGLITPRDHRWMNLLAAVTLVLLAVGWFMNVPASAIRLPQQTVWLTPKPLAPEPNLAQATPIRSTYDEGTNTLLINAEVKNVSSTPLTLTRYITGMATFVSGDGAARAKAGPIDFVGHVDVEPSMPLAPGETRQVRLRMSNPIFQKERLVPIHAPQQFVAGLLRFENGEGQHQLVLLRSNIIPIEFGPLVAGSTTR